MAWLRHSKKYKIKKNSVSGLLLAIYYFKKKIFQNLHITDLTQIENVIIKFVV